MSDFSVGVRHCVSDFVAWGAGFVSDAWPCVLYGSVATFLLGGGGVRDFVGQPAQKNPTRNPTGVEKNPTGRPTGFMTVAVCALFGLLRPASFSVVLLLLLFLATYVQGSDFASQSTRFAWLACKALVCSSPPSSIHHPQCIDLQSHLGSSFGVQTRRAHGAEGC